MWLIRAGGFRLLDQLVPQESTLPPNADGDQSAGASAAPARYRWKFRPDVEGLRAIAILPVLAFHAGLPLATGGFVGVDIFFVISGFLICGLMAGEIEKSGRLRLARFYARRARRILPSAATVLVVGAIAAWAILPPLDWQNVSRELVPASLYVANWHFISNSTDYLAPTSENSPFLHFWSLAVEEQFYLVWPGLFALVAVLFRRRLPDTTSPLRAIKVLMALATIASFAIGVWQTSAGSSAAYMGTVGRAWEFGVGACLVLTLPALMQSRVVRRFSSVIGWPGLIAIGIAVVLFDRSTPFPGTAALLPVLGTAAILLSGAVEPAPRGSVSRLLSRPVFRSIGKLSFAWYLWHWPVLIFGEALLDWDQTWQKAVLVFGSAIPAYLSLRLIENPIRLSSFISKRTSVSLAIGVAATVLAMSSGLWLGKVELPSASASSTTATPLTFDDVFGNGPNSHRNSGPVTPDPVQANADTPPLECLLGFKVETGPECWRGTPGGRTVVVFGDSHAHQLMPTVENIADKHGWSILVLTKVGCPGASIPPKNDGSWFSYKDCLNWRKAAFDRILQVKPAMVFTTSRSNYIADQKELLDSWNTTFAKFRSADIPVVYLVDTPFPDPAPTPCMSGSLNDWSACSFPKSEALHRDPVVDEANAQREPGVTVVDFTPYLCPEQRCPAARGGALFYNHETHLTTTVMRLLGPVLEDDLEKANLLDGAGAHKRQ